MNTIFKTTISFAVATLLLSGCNSSNESTDPLPQTVSGIVSDPAIEGSYVKLCLKGNTNSCLDYVASTDSNGSFNISNIPSGTTLNDYVVVATGGVDVETGESFDDLNLTVPVSELTSKTNAVVTPITSLMYSKNWTKADLATELGISQSDILKDPSTDINLQKKAILLTQIAKNSENGFGVFDTSLDGNITHFIDTKFSDEKIKKELKAISETLETNATTISKVVQNFNAIKTVLESDIYKENTSSNDTVFTNVKNWAKQILATLNENNITTPNKAQYEAILANSTLPSTMTTESNITIDVSSVNLGNIIKANALYTHTIPLNSPLGNDSDKKREYFYKSTASHLAQAENLIKGMNDVSITDTIYVDLAKGYIANNEIERALAYAKNKIFTKENKADVLRLVGESLITSNPSKAEELFDEAFILYKEVTDAKGAGNMKNTDIFDYRYLLKDYSTLNLSSKADAVTTYITSKTAEFTTTTQYGSYIVGMNQAAEELIGKGEITEAIKILDDAWLLAQNSPANNAPTGALSTQHYKAKVYYALAIAELYVQAGSSYYSKANTIADAMQTLRLDDGNSANGSYNATTPSSSGANDTSTQTKAYIGDLVAIYAATGEDAKALAVIPTATTTSYEQAGYIEYALGLAKKNDTLTNAFAIIDNNITSYTDQLKALTYNGVNKLGVYIAQYMIENNQNTKAKQAIDKAVTLLETKIAANQETTDSGKSTNYVKYGYSKFANLYALIGETTLANSYFDKAIAIANGTATTGAISTATYKVDALAQIVSHLDEVGYSTKATENLASAFDIAKTISTTKDKLTYMQKLITVDGNYSSKETIIDEMKSLIDNASENNIGESTLLANNKKIVDYLVKMSEILDQIGKDEKAKTLLTNAITYANAITVSTDKVTKLKSIVNGFANLGFITEAKTTADNITYGADKREAIASISEAVYGLDKFPNCLVATIDTDNDGKPDFYDNGATNEQIQSCNLSLDDDSDGDGKYDDTDKTPFFKD